MRNDAMEMTLQIMIKQHGEEVTQGCNDALSG